ncbi:LuxR C-terminal-related transcriptional regulator [Tengunoibacter tsumagoiensis]|nr:LuxR C-terminal-related transcriptional regulator [Tengunoibacter tsumagoiensis]
MVYTAQNVFLATKMQAPRQRSLYVQRPALYVQLQRALEGDLTLISAPAGSGKTALLAHWLSKSVYPFAWLSLEPEDDEPARFLSYFIAALQARYPQIGVSSQALLLQSPQSVRFEHVMAVLSNEITVSNLPHFIMVCDDYHLITSEAIHTAMYFLLEHLPPQMHLIFATRSDPPFPLTRLRAQGRLTELRMADLRLKKADIQTFLEQVTERELDTDILETIEERTEGWVAGVQFAALSLRNHPLPQTFLHSFHGNHRFILDYLSEEVFVRQTPAVQTFLLSTSLLERLTAPLCNELTGQANGQEILEALEKANLFVMPLDDARQWYRYHQLFAEFLQARLRQSDPEQFIVLHRRASRWYEQQGLLLEALQHAASARDSEVLVALLETYGSQCILEQDLSQKVLDWLQLLPERFYREHIHLCVLKAMAFIYSRRPTEAPPWLQRADSLVILDNDTHRLVRGRLAACYALVHLANGEIEQCADSAHRAIALLSEDEGLLYVHVMQCALHAYLATGDVTQETERLAVTALRASRTSNNHVLYLLSLTNLARIQILRGRLHQARATYHEAEHLLSLYPEQPVPPGKAEYAIGTGHILREWNELAEAEAFLQTGLEIQNNTPLLNVELMSHGHMILSRLYQAKGAYEQARGAIESLNLLLERQQFAPYLYARAAAAQADLALMNKDLATAVSWAETEKSEIQPFLSEQALLIRIRILIEQMRQSEETAQAEELHSLLQRMQEDAEAKARQASVLEIIILRALILDLMGRTSEAGIIIEQAVKLAEPEGYIRIFADKGEAVEALLARIQLDYPRRQAYVQQLRAACRPHEKADTQAVPPTLQNSRRTFVQTLVEPLSERELEVLQLIATGASNYEIAQQLIIAVATVKRHVTNIITKLNVNNRTQAVAEARKYGLVE